MRVNTVYEISTKKPSRARLGSMAIALLPVLVLFATLSFQHNGKAALAASNERTGVDKKRSPCEQVMADSLRHSRMRSTPPYIPPPRPPVPAKRVGLFLYDDPDGGGGGEEDTEGGEPGASSKQCDGTQCKKQTLYCYTSGSEARLDSGGCCVRC